MADGFSVDIQGLVEAASGVAGTLQALGAQKVSDIDADKGSFGHDDLAGTVSNFCTRWEIGVENLAKDSQEIATRLVRSAGVYLKRDIAGQQKMDRIVQGLGPDPAAG